MNDDNKARDLSDVRDAWNSYGKYLQGWADYGSRIVERNQDLWAAVDRDLSNSEFTTDAAIRSAARVMSVALRNMEDAWAMSTGPRDSAENIKVIPTAFLVFDVDDAGNPVLQNPSEIRVPPDVSADAALPEYAKIGLNGTSLDGNDAEGVAALKKWLTARLDDKRKRSYKLETTRPTPKDQQAQVAPLFPGVYDGIVYLTGPPLPLANLRVVVQGPDGDSGPARSDDSAE